MDEAGGTCFWSCHTDNCRSRVNHGSKGFLCHISQQALPCTFMIRGSSGMVCLHLSGVGAVHAWRVPHLLCLTALNELALAVKGGECLEGGEGERRRRGGGGEGRRGH